MFEKLYAQAGTGSPSAVIIALALMLFAGYLMTRLTKLVRLPNVTAYIITGILLGPYCLKAVPAQVISGTSFLPDIALAFIAFSTGEYFKVETLRKNGLKIVVITLFEALVASLVVFLVSYWVLKLPLAFSLVLAALASATAPASTMMTIRQTGSKGEFVDTLLQVVALDDVVALTAYSVAISAAHALTGAGGGVTQQIVIPILKNIGAFVLGGVFGVALTISMQRKHSTDNRLIIAIGLLFAFCGVCSAMEVSPLLGCMCMSTVYINMTGDDKLFKQLNYFSPPILLLFFVRSGLSFRLDTLFTRADAGSVSLMAAGIVYFAARICGKMGGSYLGCLVTKKPAKVRKYLGLALIPQAGVAIGLADMCARLLGNDIGTSLQTIILASSVLYEMIGPGCAKLSLYLSGSYSNKIEDIVPETGAGGEQLSEAEKLVRRLEKIRADLPARVNRAADENEEAFTEAAYEQYESRHRRGGFINR